MHGCTGIVKGSYRHTAGIAPALWRAAIDTLQELHKEVQRSPLECEDLSSSPSPTWKNPAVVACGQDPSAAEVEIENLWAP